MLPRIFDRPFGQSWRPLTFIEVAEALARWQHKTIVKQPSNALCLVAFAAIFDEANLKFAAQCVKVGVHIDWLLIIIRNENPVFAKFYKTTDN